ncbi:MAG: dTDP-4-dehydrorhamnose 3,5-epimerase [Pyrinomonadaceae bacterium]|nr:dTDP-4-dehydrorhamnose 3,5-epimerase [Pyrinomonadaceae bacterium]
MDFKETILKGAFVIDGKSFHDDRGFFVQDWSHREFAAAGLDARMVECNRSFNRSKGTLRGMHYQIAPHEQAKLVRCVRGALYDVIIDLRPDSSTFTQWVGIELTGEDTKALYLPPHFAHGFQTLLDNTVALYHTSSYYQPSSERGVRWDDPAFDIKWPQTESRIIITRDREYPDFEK